jgi:hypothetical protein
MMHERCYAATDFVNAGQRDEPCLLIYPPAVAFSTQRQTVPGLVYAGGFAAIGSPRPEITKAVATVAVTGRYKRAVCRGQPCEMIYPLRFVFKQEDK